MVAEIGVVALLAGAAAAWGMASYAKWKKKRATRLDYDMAMVALNRQLHRHPTDANAHLKIGLLKTKKRDFKGALDAFNRVLQIDPARAEAHFHRAMVLTQIGDVAEAEKEFRWIRDHSEDAYYKTAVKSLMAK